MGTVIQRKLQWNLSMSQEQKNTVMSLMEKGIQSIIIGVVMIFVTTTNGKNATVDQVLIHLENLDEKFTRLEQVNKEDFKTLQDDFEDFEKRLRSLEMGKK